MGIRTVLSGREVSCRKTKKHTNKAHTASVGTEGVRFAYSIWLAGNQRVFSMRCTALIWQGSSFQGRGETCVWRFYPVIARSGAAVREQAALHFGGKIRFAEGKCGFERADVANHALRAVAAADQLQMSNSGMTQGGQGAQSAAARAQRVRVGRCV